MGTILVFVNVSQALFNVVLVCIVTIKWVLKQRREQKRFYVELARTIQLRFETSNAMLYMATKKIVERERER